MLQLEQVVQFFHERFGTLRRPGEKILVPLVGSIVRLDKIPDVDFVFPISAVKAFPCRIIHFVGLLP